MPRSLRLIVLAIAIAVAASAREAVRALSVLHVNDLHANLLPDSRDRGGFARLATAIRREEQGCRQCILVNAGDLVQGTPVSTLFHGLPVYQIARLFRFDAATLGNHDFDYGWRMTKRFVKAGHFPVVSANVVNQQDRLFMRHAFLIRKVNGIRVGVIGALMGNLEDFETPDKLGPWHSAPPVETLRKFAAELRGRTDVTVLLAHMSAEEQEAVLRDVPEINIVIGAHVHTGMKEAKVLDNRVWVRIHCCGEELGRLDVNVDVPNRRLTAWKWRRIPIDASIPPAPDMAVQVAKWEKRVSAVVDVPIGEARREYAGEDLQLLVERAMAEEMHCDFGLMNRGGLRDRFPKGQLLARNVWNVMPFDNVVVAGKFKGSELPPVVAKAHAVDPDKEYTLATIDFIVGTGALGTKGLKFPQTGPLLRDLLINWIKKQKVLD